MGVKFLFQKDKWIGRTEADRIEADVFLSSNSVYARRVPMHPIQGGTQQADTIIKDPVTVTISGLITDTPINGAFGNSPLGGALPTLPLNLIGRKKQVQILYNKLKAIYEDTSALSLVTIKDGRERFENMALTTLSFPKTPEDGGGFRFSASFVEVITTGSAKVTVEEITEKDGDGSPSDQAGSTEKGSGATVEAKTSTPARASVNKIAGNKEFLPKLIEFLFPED